MHIYTFTLRSEFLPFLYLAFYVHFGLSLSHVLPFFRKIHLANLVEEDLDCLTAQFLTISLVP